MYISECRRNAYLQAFETMGFSIVKNESTDESIVMELKPYDGYRVIITVFGRNGCNTAIRWFEKGSLYHHEYHVYKRGVFDKNVWSMDIQAAIMDDFRKWHDESSVICDGC